jgi:hypothetical protein
VIVGDRARDEWARGGCEKPRGYALAWTSKFAPRSLHLKVELRDASERIAFRAQELARVRVFSRRGHTSP